MRRPQFHAYMSNHLPSVSSLVSSLPCFIFFYDKRTMKRFLLGSICLISAFLAGCGSATTSTILFDWLQVAVPTTYTAISNAQLDSYQIVNKVLKAYKNGTRTMIIARSALTANMSPSEYATASKEKLAQWVPGYTYIKDGSISFTCGKNTSIGYTHFFSILDNTQDNPWKTYVAQYYFISQGTAYIISEADRSDSHYSDFTSLIDSLQCN